MRKLIAIIFWLFSSLAAISQTTAVTATITDSDSTVWINPQWSVQFVPNPNFPQLSSYSIGGVPITSNTYSQYIQVSGTGNNSGLISTTLLDNGQVLPAGSTYRFVMQSQTSAPATTYTPIKITGGSQSLTSYLSTNAISPRFPAILGAFGYADAEISITPQPGGYYYNVVNAIQRVWNGNTWTNGGGNGSSLLSQKVVYVSKLVNIPASTAVIPGSSSSGSTDALSIIQTACGGGNVDCEVDGGWWLSNMFIVSSNTTIHCTSPQNGFALQSSSNAFAVIGNANQNSPTTASGTGGFLPSNITDKNIKVIGCQTNANSTEATTGTNSQGTAHGATPGGKFTYGMFFLGVNGLTIDGNEIYDSGCWGIFTSNIFYERITNNYIHQPSPLVQSKFTDGIHHIGPHQFFWWQNNRLNCGDDCLAVNADDGNRTGSGDVNASYVQAAVKWGPELDGNINNNSLDGSSYGLRLYSATELIDRIFITNTSGTLCGNTAVIGALSAIGTGNIGKIVIDGWTVQTTGTCNTFSIPYNFQVTANYQNIELDHLNIVNPTVTWPIWQETSPSPGIKSFHNWELNTQSSGFSNLIVLNGGSTGQLALSGINWWDSAGTGSVVSGTAALNTLTCSNYAGPNRLLAAGFVPINQNGDCFTNIYTATTTYVNTIFSEATSGALATTTPATCINGCTGTWTAASGGPSGTGVWTYGTNQVTLSGPCTSGGTDNFCPVYINTGHPNFTMRTTVNQFAFGGGTLTGLCFVVRWTDNANFVAFVPNGAPGTSQTWGLYDVVANVTTQIGSSIALGRATGTWTVVMNGTSAKLTNPIGTSLTGTISGSNTSNNIGLSNNYASFVGLGTDVVTSLSVKSN